MNGREAIFLFATVFAAGASAPVAASEPIREMQPERWFNPARCDDKHDERLGMSCAKDREIFVAEMELAFRGDYQGQDNLKSYFSGSGEGAVIKTPYLACAWSTIIVNYPSENIDYYGGDLQTEARDMLRHCDALDRADAAIVPSVVERIVNPH